MSQPLHSGPHLDPDSLSAFLEGALPEHERQACAAHLAACADCRAVAFLAEEPAPSPILVMPKPAWRRWFAPLPVLGAAAAGILAIAISLRMPRPAPPPPLQVARVEEPRVATTPPLEQPA